MVMSASALCVLLWLIDFMLLKNSRLDSFFPHRVFMEQQGTYGCTYCIWLNNKQSLAEWFALCFVKRLNKVRLFLCLHRWHTAVLIHWPLLIWITGWLIQVGLRVNLILAGYIQIQTKYRITAFLKKKEEVATKTTPHVKWCYKYEE